MSDGTGLAYLLDRLGAVERGIRDAVVARRAADPNPEDPFRGLYLSDEVVDALLASRREPFPVPVPADGASPGDGRLARLAAAAGLTPLDERLLLVACAPDVDSRFEQFYGYLNDDVTRRRASVGLALRLCGVPEAAARGRARLDPGAPLRSAGLLLVEEPDRPFLSRTLRVPDRVLGHLLGDDRPDPALAPVLGPDDPAEPLLPGVDRLGRAIGAGVRLAYLRERPGGSGLALGAAALHAAGRAALGVDAPRLFTAADAPTVARAVLREALLRGAGIVAGPVDAAVADANASTVDLTGLLDVLAGAPVPVILYGTAGWDPRWSRQPPLHLDALPVPAGHRGELWRAALDGRLPSDVDAAAVTAHFVLAPPAVRRAAEAASLAALSDGTAVGAEHLRRGARSQNAAGLERLARRTEPAVDWTDLVLPTAILGQLRELAARARHRDRVLDEWRMRPGGGRGRGVTGLFAGDSGTGKTMSAEVIAADLGMDLYTVNLATVVDKYVGETEKNLERIFVEAAGVNGVLLFDEADAIFGRRSEVRDAHDRYANIESAYLLQRMESFDGLAILATNLRANLDEAFTRRLDMMIDFPLPDEALRRGLWDRCLGRVMPRDADVDLDFLAAGFELTGGHIRSAAVTAAYLAAEGGRPVTMADAVGGVAREYRKLGRLCLDREFGPYLAMVS
ncbi:MAG: hypothetical protein V7603_5901 [Micromonosporaceae bacterium]